MWLTTFFAVWSFARVPQRQVELGLAYFPVRQLVAADLHELITNDLNLGSSEYLCVKVELFF